MLATKQGQPQAIQLADTFCIEARDRIEQLFRTLYGAHDAKMYALAMSVMKGEHAWLEQGIVDERSFMGIDAELPAARAESRQTAGVA
jgi:hypothetical protein